GRKLGGVIEVTTARDARPGFHGKVSAGGGSFDTADAYAEGQYGWSSNTLSVSARGATTARYLDPPVEQNFTNRGTTTNFALHYERDISADDRIGVIVRHGMARFEVPNEFLQQQAGQRQDRQSTETMALLSYQHIFSPSVLGDVRGMLRDLSAGLRSNALSTPIAASQDRGVREEYVKASLSAHQGGHELKAGVEQTYGTLREAFQYLITDPTQFDPRTPPQFAFAGRHGDSEQAAFVQDLYRHGNFTLTAGLRFDRYRLVVADSAFSPRLGAAYFWRPAGLLLRASYDRVFQTPASENLLLASSTAVAALSDQVVRLPVEPSRGNFFEVGVSRSLLQRVRLDATVFERRAAHFADDDVLLNTGVSFPIAFRKSEIHGVEAKLEMPRWGRFSGFLSYSNMTGLGYLPVTGGLLLGSDAASSLSSRASFAVTQDQRNTARARLRVQALPRLWAALSGTYGSGLPVEFAGERQDAVDQYGERLASRVNFARGRVRPSFSLDGSVGIDLHKTDAMALRLQVDAANLTNRLNVIDFAGLFSGTALAPPRSVSLRLAADF
ncbi:MAG TPA: TonB-dependent receptor, partial [Solibacterales bacterium]|nr:TonB-dependent receptor [Bryobacterales bacterium]